SSACAGAGAGDCVAASAFMRIARSWRMRRADRRDGQGVGTVEAASPAARLRPAIAASEGPATIPRPRRARSGGGFLRAVARRDVLLLRVFLRRLLDHLPDHL